MRLLSMLMVLACAIGLSSAAAQTTTTYSYDSLGRLTRVDRPNGAVSYAFDAADNRSNVSSFNPYAASWEAEALWHAVGFAEGGGWATNVSTAPGHMVYGPYTNGVPTGSRVAAFRIMIDAPSGNPADFMTSLSVYDATAGQILAIQHVQRSRWRLPFQYETIEVPFTMDVSRAGHLIEFQVYHYGAGYVRVDKVGYR